MTSRKSESSELSRPQQILKWIFLALFAGMVLLVVSSCTVSPHALDAPSQASFDGNQQNSGIIMSTPSGYVVTDGFRMKYNRLIATYGGDLKSPATVDAGIAPIGEDRWLITKQRMIDYLDMCAWRDAALPPKNPK